MGLRENITAIGALLRGPVQPKVRASFCLFKPKPDITAFELAVILASLKPASGGAISYGVYVRTDGTTLAKVFEAWGAPGAERHFDCAKPKDYG